MDSARKEKYSLIEEVHANPSFVTNPRVVKSPSPAARTATACEEEAATPAMQKSASALMVDAVKLTEQQTATPAEEQTATSPKEQQAAEKENFENLDLALIKYISDSQRIMKIEDKAMWLDFQKEHDAHFGGLTWSKIRTHFVYDLLPRIFEYELDTDSKTLFRLLDINPNFERAGRGYLHLPTHRQVTSSHEPILNKDFRIVEGEVPIMSNSEATKLELTSPNEPHTLISGVAPTSAATPLSKENYALLSAFFSTDSELSTFKLLDVKDLKLRLAEARKQYQQNGQMPPNAMPASRLVPKLENYLNNGEVMASLINQSTLH